MLNFFVCNAVIYVWLCRLWAGAQVLMDVLLAF